MGNSVQDGKERFLGAEEVKDTTRNFTESTELDSQGITEISVPT